MTKGPSMIRFRSIYLLPLTLLALGGIWVSGASAHTPATFTAEQNVTRVTGKPDGPYEIRATGQNVTCEIAELEGTVVGTSVQQATLTPRFTECTAFGFINAKITGFGHYPASEGAGPYCDLVLNATSKGDLVCPAGKDVTLDGGTCTVHVPAQTGAETFTFTKITREGKKAFTVDVHLTTLTSTHTDSFGCPFAGGAESTNTTAIGNGEVWGEDPETGKPVGISLDQTVP
jgi:hypothetical protein